MRWESGKRGDEVPKPAPTTIARKLSEVRRWEKAKAVESSENTRRVLRYESENGREGE